MILISIKSNKGKKYSKKLIEKIIKPLQNEANFFQKNTRSVI